MVMVEWMLWDECFVGVVGEFVGYSQEIEHFPKGVIGKFVCESDGEFILLSQDCGIIWIGMLWRD